MTDGSPPAPSAPRTAPREACTACGRPAATRRSLRGGRCRDCREHEQREVGRARSLAAIRGLLDREDVLILDTETTGMRGAEVIEVGVIDTTGRVRLDTLIEPRTRSMNPYAQRVHGLRMQDLLGHPTWPSVLPQLAAIADRSTLLAWNAPFDARMLEQTSQAWGLEHPRWLFACAMKMYAGTKGLSKFGLQKAVAAEGLEHLWKEHASHRAVGDAFFTLEVLRTVARSSS